MLETFGRPDHVILWQKAAEGVLPDWEVVFDGFVAIIDWPAAAFWHETSDQYPDAIVLLATRSDSDTWWSSANATIFEILRQEPRAGMEAWHAMWSTIVRERFSPNVDNRDAAIAAYEAHNEAVRDAIPAHRLVEWQPSDGWAPLCEALGVPEPLEAFPHVNTRSQFRSSHGWD